MMIKITEKCSMGCTHCWNRATPTGKHMDFDTFKKAIAFQQKHGNFCIITGGEPTEHPEFERFIQYTIDNLQGYCIIVTTNGVWMQTHEEFIKDLNTKYGPLAVMFQVTSDKRFYPIQIDLSLPVFKYLNVVVCDKVEHISPQGRALDNNLEWESKASKCFNIRAAANQIKHQDLRTVIELLAARGKFCTPSISIDGHIKVGESDLCPNCSHIDKSNSEIMKDIINFRCNGCKHINDKLPENYRKIIGEE